MKTVKQWLKEGSNKEDYRKAKIYKNHYSPFNSWHETVDSFKRALEWAFIWENVFEGFDYWKNIYDNNGSIKKEKSKTIITDYLDKNFDTETQKKIEKKVEERIQKKIMDSIVESVCQDLQNRSEIGIKKYGTTLDRTDIDEEGWQQHLYEELLDAACYLKRLMIK